MNVENHFHIVIAPVYGQESIYGWLAHVGYNVLLCRTGRKGASGNTKIKQVRAHVASNDRKYGCSSDV